ncbi:MAG: L-serine ammonia-lyase, iron-sulfur-dependent, subunit alpha [Eubacteriales bacterium]|nr:L-serine ammonia-lyase, iron-sulfur-dependent, subunit alpha [Eubacteriales bacterium]
MEYNSFAAWLDAAEKESKALWELALAAELSQEEMSEAEIYRALEERLLVMESSAERGLSGLLSHSGLSGGDAKKLAEYRQSGGILSDFTLNVMSKAIAINECNAAMGVICATPTAGSAGTCAAVLLAAAEDLKLSRLAQQRFLISAGYLGRIIGNLASLSGAAGGCQAEVGSASAMAAFALVEAAGGAPAASGHAAAIALKNLLGLACDPVAGLVEIPCIKRNVMGAVNALSAAELALAGIESKIPLDEVIVAMGKVGQAMPATLRETALGGLAATPTAKRYADQLFNSTPAVDSSPETTSFD